MTGPPTYLGGSKGYKAFMMEYRFPGAEPMAPDASCNLLSGNKCYHYTTEVAIVPNTYPYPNCCTVFDTDAPECTGADVVMCDEAPLM